MYAMQEYSSFLGCRSITVERVNPSRCIPYVHLRAPDPLVLVSPGLASLLRARDRHKGKVAPMPRSPERNIHTRQHHIPQQLFDFLPRDVEGELAKVQIDSCSKSLSQWALIVPRPAAAAVYFKIDAFNSKRG